MAKATSSESFSLEEKFIAFGVVFGTVAIENGQLELDTFVDVFAGGHVEKERQVVARQKVATSWMQCHVKFHRFIGGWAKVARVNDRVSLLDVAIAKGGKVGNAPNVTECDHWESTRTFRPPFVETTKC